MNLDEYHQCIILHSRSYKETSCLLTLWLKGVGKISAIVKGARSKKKTNIYRPFNLLNIRLKLSKSADGLANVYDAEQEKPFASGTYLAHLSRLYLNEILYWLLPNGHCDCSLFNMYIKTIQLLVTDNVKIYLREFELALLVSLGYSFQCDIDNNNNPIVADQYYLMNPLSAFYKVAEGSGFKGEIIHKINTDISSWTDYDMRIIHKLIKLNIDSCLSGKEIKTRDLVRNYLS